MLRSHRFLAPPLLATALLLGACGGGDSDSDIVGGSGGESEAASDSGAAATGGEQEGSADCSVLTAEDVAAFGFGVQLLAQVIRPDQVDAVGEGGLGYSPDEMASVLTRMHTVLDGRPAEGHDDPRDAIAFYEDLNERMRVLLGTPPPVSQALIDEYVAVSGGIAGGIGRQLPIGAALSEHCPELAG